jgi:hypothetical protein
MLGLKNEKKTEKKLSFDDDEKRFIIEDFLQNGGSKQAIWEKYGGYGEEHGRILRWMRQIGYIADPKRKDANFAPQKDPMNHLKKVKETYSYFEYAKLQKRIEELEKQLCESELQAITYQTMVEVAERELNISIKKKFNTKPLKK